MRSVSLKNLTILIGIILFFSSLKGFGATTSTIESARPVGMMLSQGEASPNTDRKTGSLMEKNLAATEPFLGAGRNLINLQNASSSTETAQELTARLNAIRSRKGRAEKGLFCTLRDFINQIPETIQTGKISFEIQSIDNEKGVLKTGKVYAALSDPINWSLGYSTIYFGVRKKDLSQMEFLSRCRFHILFAREKLAVGHLRGYLFFLGDDFYVSFANWESKEFQEMGGKTQDGQVVVADGLKLMDHLLWTDARNIPHDYSQKLLNALYRLTK
ncbi:MAG: hypothetical protein HQM08_23300 [Candidatus Riflebacteria bacterium]|nr:hypothetical protein [Candidatus Riflebacteria bacterium]